MPRWWLNFGANLGRVCPASGQHGLNSEQGSPTSQVQRTLGEPRPTAEVARWVFGLLRIVAKQGSGTSLA